MNDINKIKSPITFYIFNSFNIEMNDINKNNSM